jgi:hypothetical protein
MTPPPPPLLPGKQAKKPTFKPILITLLCSFLLAGGSCFGFLNKATSGGQWQNVFMDVFLIAAFSFVAACVWLIVRAVGIAIHKKR